MRPGSNSSARTATIAFAIAGVAFLVRAYHFRNAPSFVWAMQLAVALIFFLASYRWYALYRAGLTPLRGEDRPS